MRHQRQPVDNPEVGQPRLPGVGDADWDVRLRRSLAEQAGRAPVPRADLAGDVLTRAGRIRRRRSLSGVVAAVVATLVFGGLFTHSLSPGGERAGLQPVTGVGDPFRFPSPPPPPELAEDTHLPERLFVDLVGEGSARAPVLATATGDLIELPGVGAVVSAHRTSDGWALISGSPGTLRLWWVPAAEGAPVPLLSEMDALVVHQDKVAWQRGTLLGTGTLVEGAVTGRTTTTLPGQEIALADLAGPTVVLRRSTVEPVGAWDVWHPDRGDYSPTWDEDIQWIYGTAGADNLALGLVPSPESHRDGADAVPPACLAWWDLSVAPGRELVPVQTSCLPQRLSTTGPGAVSPDGRWLLAGSADGVLLADLTALAEQPDTPGSVTLLEEVPELIGNPVWLDSQQVVLPVDGELIRVWPVWATGTPPQGQGLEPPEAAQAGVERFPLTGSLPVVVQPG